MCKRSICFETGECIVSARRPEVVIKSWLNRKKHNLNGTVKIGVYKGVTFEGGILADPSTGKLSGFPMKEQSFFLDNGQEVCGETPYNAAERSSCLFPVGSRMTLLDINNNTVFNYRVLSRSRNPNTGERISDRIIFIDSYQV